MRCDQDHCDHIDLPSILDNRIINHDMNSKTTKIFIISFIFCHCHINKLWAAPEYFYNPYFNNSSMTNESEVPLNNNHTPDPSSIPNNSDNPSELLINDPDSDIQNSDKPSIQLESIELNYKNDEDNLQRSHQIIEPQFNFSLNEQENLQIQTGLNRFNQPNQEEIINIPLQVNWQGKINDLDLEIGGGIDTFNRLPTSFNFNLKAQETIPLQMNENEELISWLTISANVNHEIYKFNATTLENGIKSWRMGPDIYWQINQQTSLFSSLRFGLYNDSNQEWQSFNRLQYNLDSFFIAGNLFNWSYHQNLEEKSGYFSPSDFLIYNGELGWQGRLFEFLDCQASVYLGRQRLNGLWDDTYGYKTNCLIQFNPSISFNLGYNFSNVFNSNNADKYHNESLIQELKIKF